MTSRLLAVNWLLVAVSLVACAGCKPQSEVRNAVKQLAPPGGRGVKQYFYKSGELMEQTYWEDYDVVKSVYFDKNGRELLSSDHSAQKVLQITLNENGEITEIFQSTDFVKNGYCFVLKDGTLQKIQTLEDGTLLSETVVSEKLDGSVSGADKASHSPEY